jgi:hypothetical protein
MSQKNWTPDPEARPGTGSRREQGDEAEQAAASTLPSVPDTPQTAAPYRRFFAFTERSLEQLEKDLASPPPGNVCGRRRWAGKPELTCAKPRGHSGSCCVRGTSCPWCNGATP